MRYLLLLFMYAILLTKGTEELYQPDDRIVVIEPFTVPCMNNENLSVSELQIDEILIVKNNPDTNTKAIKVNNEKGNRIIYPIYFSKVAKLFQKGEELVITHDETFYDVIIVNNQYGYDIKFKKFAPPDLKFPFHYTKQKFNDFKPQKKFQSEAEKKNLKFAKGDLIKVTENFGALDRAVGKQSYFEFKKGDILIVDHEDIIDNQIITVSNEKRGSAYHNNNHISSFYFSSLEKFIDPFQKGDELTITHEGKFYDITVVDNFNGYTIKFNNFAPEGVPLKYSRLKFIDFEPRKSFQLEAELKKGGQGIEKKELDIDLTITQDILKPDDIVYVESEGNFYDGMITDIRPNNEKPDEYEYQVQFESDGMRKSSFFSADEITKHGSGYIYKNHDQDGNLYYKNSMTKESNKIKWYRYPAEKNGRKFYKNSIPRERKNPFPLQGIQKVIENLGEEKIEHQTEWTTKDGQEYWTFYHTSTKCTYLIYQIPGEKLYTINELKVDFPLTKKNQIEIMVSGKKFQGTMYAAARGHYDAIRPDLIHWNDGSVWIEKLWTYGAGGMIIGKKQQLQSIKHNIAKFQNNANRELFEVQDVVVIRLDYAVKVMQGKIKAQDFLECVYTDKDNHESLQSVLSYAKEKFKENQKEGDKKEVKLGVGSFLEAEFIAKQKQEHYLDYLKGKNTSHPELYVLMVVVMDLNPESKYNPVDITFFTGKREKEDLNNPMNLIRREMKEELGIKKNDANNLKNFTFHQVGGTYFYMFWLDEFETFEESLVSPQRKKDLYRKAWEKTHDQNRLYASQNNNRLIREETQESRDSEEKFG